MKTTKAQVIDSRPFPFWLVWKPYSDLPKCKHLSEGSAHSEAMRLADLHPGDDFWVLKAQGLASVSKMPAVYTKARP